MRLVPPTTRMRLTDELAWLAHESILSTLYEQTSIPWVRKAIDTAPAGAITDLGIYAITVWLRAEELERWPCRVIELRRPGIGKRRHSRKGLAIGFLDTDHRLYARWEESARPPQYRRIRTCS